MRGRAVQAGNHTDRGAQAAHGEPVTAAGRRWSPRRTAGCAIVLLAFLPGAGAQYAVRNGTVAAGGGVSTAPPYKLIGTIGEPAQGATSNPPYRLVSGYPATIGTPAPVVDGLFRDSFEDP
jgi:hypothetical protein